MKFKHSILTGILLSFTCLSYAATKRLLGLPKTLILSEMLSYTVRRLAKFVGMAPPSEPNVACVLAWLRRLANHVPWIACFEQACALQLWLASHEIPSTIVIGKCTQGNLMRMHAWIECAEQKYFYDDQFEAIWRSDMLIKSKCQQRAQCPQPKKSQHQV